MSLIAIVNADVVLTDLLTQWFALRGHRSLQIHSQAKAVEAIRAIQPDLILLDTWLESPYGGWQVLRQLKADAATSEIPVVLLDDMPSQSFSEDAASRPNFALPKPFDFDELLAVIDSLGVGSARPIAPP